jgi:cytosine/adenosine deaminase-related metal-dependent hydrolase
MRPAMDVVVRAGVIDQVVATGAEVSGIDTVVECQGCLIVPAFANIHHHFYSAFLRGAPSPRPPPRDQRERLERVVWPYERSLVRDDVRLAVQYGLLEAVAAGTTAIIDHHVSAGCVDGILDVIAEEIVAANLRAVLCYEVTDRDGERIAAAGLRETERFLTTLKTDHGQIAAMVGLHAMSTVGDDTLAAAVDLARRYDAGIHLHVGEAAHDSEVSICRYGDRPLARLERAGALNMKTLVAHAVQVTPEEMALLAQRGVMVAHNPRSNASNGVGVADLAALRQAGIVTGIGGDGFTQDIRGELPLMALLQRQAFHDPQVLPPDEALAIGVTDNAAIAERLTGWRMGAIAPGYAADVTVLDGEPIVPIAAHNAEWLLANGLPGFRVRDVYAGGQAVLAAGQPTTLDAERIRYDLRRRLPAIWQRTEASS